MQSAYGLGAMNGNSGFSVNIRMNIANGYLDILFRRLAGVPHGFGVIYR